MTDNILLPEEIKTLTVDGTSYAVGELPEHVQRLVHVYNQWRQDQTVARLELMKVESALRTLSNEIVTALQKEQEAAAGSSDPETATPETTTETA